MCGINGVFLKNPIDRSVLHHHTLVMNKLIKHRGPDGEGIWLSKDNKLALGHVRLSVIDLSKNADQPFIDDFGNIIVFNGEIYNYLELRDKLKEHWQFKTKSDTEVILAAYNHYGPDCVQYFEGMFAFAIWDANKNNLLIARDRVGIKPLYYYENNNGFYFSSEVKAILPFIDNLKINKVALTEYFVFQYPLQEDLIYDNVLQLLPGEMMLLKGDSRKKVKYWDMKYDNQYQDFDATKKDFSVLMQDSIDKHLRSDVPVGTYLSGGVDTSLISMLAKQSSYELKYAINGRFLEGNKDFDESDYAKDVARNANLDLQVLDITASDFEKNINKIIYHLDYPIAGPGVFPQFMVSQEASKHVKVILGGQGGDELFGGYARYLLMYFSEIINCAIDGDLNNKSLRPNPHNILEQLSLLQQYKPLFQQFMQKDCFADQARRYYNLINRSSDFNSDEVDSSQFPLDVVYERYNKIFNSAKMEQDFLLNKVLHFDFKCSLPALLHVEDRVSMAHGLESRVPLLDHRVVEFSTKIAPDIKFTDGQMKAVLKNSFREILPNKILDRKDKMGFPYPLNQWAKLELKEFLYDTLSTSKSKTRPFVNYSAALNNLKVGNYSRKLWGFLSLEIWFQQFYDNHNYYKGLLEQKASHQVIERTESTSAITG